MDALAVIADHFRANGRLSRYLPAADLRVRILDAIDDGEWPGDLFTFGDIGRLMSWTGDARALSDDLAAELRDTARVIWEGLTGAPGGFPFTRVEARAAEVSDAAHLDDDGKAACIAARAQRLGSEGR